MSELKNYWSTILPNLLTIIGGVILFLLGVRLSSILGGVVLNLYLLFEISRRKPWHELNEQEKVNAKYFWTVNTVWPGFMFIAVISNIVFSFRPSLSLSLYVVVIGVIVMGVIGWYLTAKGISERYVSKVLEKGGILWRERK